MPFTHGCSGTQFAKSTYGCCQKNWFLKKNHFRQCLRVSVWQQLEARLGCLRGTMFRRKRRGHIKIDTQLVTE